MTPNTRPQCYAIPSERIVMLYWTRTIAPTGWQQLWRAIAKAWR